MATRDPHSVTNIAMLGTDHFIFGGWGGGGRIFPQAQSFVSEEVRASRESEYFFLFGLASIDPG